MNRIFKSILFAGLTMFAVQAHGQILLEAETFEAGSWKTGYELADEPGSAYLQMTGTTGAAATKEFIIPIATGTFQVYARTYTPADSKGGFVVKIHHQELQKKAGLSGKGWKWEKVGTIDLSRALFKKGFRAKGQGEWHRMNGAVATIELVPEAGSKACCDAIFLTQDKGFRLPDDPAALRPLRKQWLGLPETPDFAGSYDLVVLGKEGLAVAQRAASKGLRAACICEEELVAEGVEVFSGLSIYAVKTGHASQKEEVSLLYARSLAGGREFTFMANSYEDFRN